MIRAAGPAAPGRPASLPRRFACAVYEGVLLFGVVMVTGLIYAGLVQQRHALHGRHGLQAVLFVVLAGYFVWFWSHGGQTVAMKAWSIRLETAEGRGVTPQRAFARFLVAWLWFLPALLGAWLGAIGSTSGVFGLLGLGVVGYAALTVLAPERQFLHDVVCRTRLSDAREAGE